MSSLNQNANGAASAAKTTATDRALACADYVAGGMSFARARRKSGASYGYGQTAVHLSPTDLDLVRRGLMRISDFHAKPVSDEAVYAFVARVGIDRVWKALDRLTAPAMIAAE